jgi:hypothetical protein
LSRIACSPLGLSIASYCDKITLILGYVNSGTGSAFCQHQSMLDFVKSAEGLRLKWGG